MTIDSFFHLNIFGFSALGKDVHILSVDELSHLDPAAKFSFAKAKTLCNELCEHRRDLCQIVFVHKGYRR